VVKPLAKDKDHTVEIFRDGKQFVVAEDPALFGQRMSVKFAGLAVDEWPVDGVAGWLRDVRTRPAGKAPAAAPRTDILADKLAPLCKIASRRNEMLEVYRWHQRLPVHVQIGPAYRAVIKPFQWQDEDPNGGKAPAGDVYPLVLDKDVFAGAEV
ncbi:MAG TPA: hypothetical protein VFQ42_04320, partial [Mycobacterium sp.]|nr:hypothetical protein [Mycobacterium sp.]